MDRWIEYDEDGRKMAKFMIHKLHPLNVLSYPSYSIIFGASSLELCSVLKNPPKSRRLDNVGRRRSLAVATFTDDVYQSTTEGERERLKQW